MSNDLNWKEWFAENKNVTSTKVTGSLVLPRRTNLDIGTEEMYQAFKARLIDELAVQAPDLRTLGVLVERPEDDGS